MSDRPPQGHSTNPYIPVGVTLNGMEYSIDNVDPETGELREDDQQDGPRRVYIPGAKGLAHYTNLARLPLTGLEYQVLFAILSQVKPREGVYAHTTLQQIADALDKHPKSIERVTASLRHKNIITRGRHGIWEVNPRLGWQGSFNDWATKYADAPEPDWTTNANGLDGKKLPELYNRTTKKEQP